MSTCVRRTAALTRPRPSLPVAPPARCACYVSYAVLCLRSQHLRSTYRHSRPPSRGSLRRSASSPYLSYVACQFCASTTFSEACPQGSDRDVFRSGTTTVPWRPTLARPANRLVLEKTPVCSPRSCDRGTGVSSHQ